MLTKVLRFVLGLLNTESLAFAVQAADDEYTEALKRAHANRAKTLSETEEATDRTLEALGSVLFVAGQQLSIVQRVKSDIAKAKEKL